MESPTAAAASSTHPDPVAASAHAQVSADPAPQAAPPAAVSGHPSYDEMIVAAISALKSPGGSSKKAIADYIEQNYPRLPHDHSTALAVHLRDLKAAGRLFMVRSNYRLADQGQGSSSRPKRGRPTKAKANATPKPAPAVAHATRKRGRPASVTPAKKEDKGKAVATGDGAGSSKRPRGRPPKVNVVPFANEPESPVRRRGRPSKTDTATAGPSGSGRAKSKKKATRSTAAADSALTDRVEFELLQKKVQVMQTRIKNAAAVLRPHLAGQASPAVMDAIIELEAIAAMDV